MRKSFALAALTLTLSSAALTQDSSPTLVEDGAVKVDATDFRASLARIPEATRGNVLASYDRVATLVDSLFITRSLAARARAAGLDKDPLVQRRIEQAAEAVLADLYVSGLEKELTAVSLEQRARELYRADPSKFRTDEQVHIQQILVNMQGRTREQALQRARMIAEKAQAGQDDFIVLAGQYSDDPEKRGNRGDLGYNSPKSLVEPIRKALPAMKPGQVSAPIESEYGFHIVKLIAVRKPEQLSYEQVSEQIIRDERQRLMKQRVDGIITQIRSSSTATVHRDKVEALVVPLPAEVTSGKFQEKAAKK